MIYYFGTFNPIHKGHLQIASEVEKYFNDIVEFIPAYDSPWKPGLKDNYNHRLEMIKLCTCHVINLESKLPTPSYTAQSVMALKTPGETRLKVIIGIDAFKNIKSWKKWEYLKDNCFFIIIPRCNEDYNSILDLTEENIKFCIFGMTPINISSTEVRKGNLDFVTPEVANYIKEHKLY
jgi:nicotinate-nucleotide adenylyltransferase